MEAQSCILQYVNCHFLFTSRAVQTHPCNMFMKNGLAFRVSDSVIIVMFIRFYYPQFQFLSELSVQLTLSSKVFPKTNIHYIYTAYFDQLLKPTLKFLDKVQLLELKGTYQPFMILHVINKSRAFRIPGATVGQESFSLEGMTKDCIKTFTSV